MTEQPVDAFPCAVGSDAPTRVLTGDGRQRCPLCRHLAVNHDLTDEGTCDICRAARLIVNSLADAARRGGRSLRAAICTSCGQPICRQDCPEALVNGWPMAPTVPIAEPDMTDPPVSEPTL